MATGKQAVSVQQDPQEASEPNVPKRQFVVVAHDPKYSRLSHSLILPGENAIALAELRLSLADDLKPKGTLENECVDEITACFWRLRRVRAFETGLFAQAIFLDPKVVEIEKESPAYRANLRKKVMRLRRLLGKIHGRLESEESPEPETDTIEEDENECEVVPELILTSEPKRCILGRAFSRAENGLVKLTNHEACIVRSLDRALGTLDWLQSIRGRG